MSQDAALIIGLLNTAHLPDGADGLATADPVQWIADGLNDDGRGLHPREATDSISRARTLGDLLELREALRAFTQAPGAAAAPNDKVPAAVRRYERVNHILRAHPVVVHLQPLGGPSLLPVSSQRRQDRAFAAVGSAVLRCSVTGTLARVKTCARSECQWAFYDESKNRSRRWCSMSGCGNLMKNRRYRARADHT